MSRAITVSASAKVVSSGAATISRTLTVSAVGVRRLPTAQCTISMGRTVTANPIAAATRVDILMGRSVTASARQTAGAICKIFIGRIPPAPIRMGMSMVAIPNLSWTARCNIKIGLLTGTRIGVGMVMSVNPRPTYRYVGQVPIQRAMTVGAIAGVLVRSSAVAIALGRAVVAASRVNRPASEGIGMGRTVVASPTLRRLGGSDINTGLFITANSNVQSAAGTTTAIVVPHITVGAKGSVLYSGQVLISRTLTTAASARHTVPALCNILTRCQLGPIPPVPAGIKMWFIAQPGVMYSMSASLAMGRTVMAAGRHRRILVTAIALGRNVSATVSSTGLNATLGMGRAVGANATVQRRSTDPIATRMALIAAAMRLIPNSVGIAMGRTVTAISSNLSTGASATILTRCQMVATGQIKFGISDLILRVLTVLAIGQVLRKTAVTVQSRMAVGAAPRVMMGGVAGISMSAGTDVGTGSGSRVPGSVMIGMGRTLLGTPRIIRQSILTAIQMRFGIVANPSIRISGQTGIQTRMAVHVMGGKSNLGGIQISTGMTMRAVGLVQFLGGAKGGIRGAGPQGTIRGAGPQKGGVRPIP